MLQACKGLPVWGGRGRTLAPVETASGYPAKGIPAIPRPEARLYTKTAKSCRWASNPSKKGVTRSGMLSPSN